MMEGPPDDRPYYLTPNDVTEWLKMNYKLGKDGHMAKSAIYDDYLELCELRGAKPIISPTFYGKLVKRAFPGIQSIRKGPRGQVRQCYARLKKRKNPVALPSDDDTSARDVSSSSGSSGSVHRQEGGQADTHQSGRSSPLDHQAHRSPPSALHPAGYISSYPHMAFNLPPVAPALDARHPSLHHPAYLAHLPTHPQHFARVPFPTPAYPGMMNLPTPQGYRLDADRQPQFIDGLRVKHEQEEWRDGNRIGGVYDGRDHHGGSSGPEASVHGGGLPEAPSWTSLRRSTSSHSFHERHGNGDEAGSGSESPGSLESPSAPQLPPFYHPSPSGLPDPSQALPHPVPRHYTTLDSYSYGDTDRGHMATRTLSDPYASPLHFSSSPLLQSPSLSAQLPAITSPSLSRPGLTPHHPFMPSHVPYSRQLPDLHGGPTIGRGPGPSSSSAATGLLSLGGSAGDSIPRYISTGGLSGPSANSLEKDHTRSS